MERTEAELIAAVLRGDAASFEPLVEKYSPRIFAMARRYARRESEVEDIAQQIWLKAFERLSSYRSEAPFEHWLMRLAVRTCYDSLRAHQRNRETAFSAAHGARGGLAGPVRSRTGFRPGRRRGGAPIGRARVGAVIAGCPVGHHLAGNRRAVSEGNRETDRLVGAAGQGARFPGAGRNAPSLVKNGHGEVFVTTRSHEPSKTLQAI